jgi:hypothetical protein
MSVALAAGWLMSWYIKNFIGAFCCAGKGRNAYNISTYRMSQLIFPLAATLFDSVFLATAVSANVLGLTEVVTLNFERTILNIPGKSLVAVEVEYAPGAASPSHTHAKSAFI